MTLGKDSEVAIINITVEKCENLQVNKNSAFEVKPFFYYKFYTFDDHFSKSKASNNPIFRDKKSYTVPLDEVARNYLRNDSL